LTTPRIYVPTPCIIPTEPVPADHSPSVIPAQAGIHGSIILGKEHLRYVKSVLRMKKGDTLTLFDGTGWEYETVITRISADGIAADIVHKRCAPEESLRVTLIQSMPKANKMDFIVQKATELGAHRIIPFQSSRSVPRLSPEKAASRITRWQSIAVEAARQCGRADVPEISGMVSFEEAISLAGQDALKLIFWEEESKRGVKQALRDPQHADVRNLTVIIGPEGGFTKEEVADASGKGFISVSLGKQVLKVETAVVTILSIIQYEKGFFGGILKEGQTP
jgi:16S rRNA (uracil1498-N3)-methyltransferase